MSDDSRYWHHYETVAYFQQSRLLNVPSEGVPPTIHWTGITNLEIVWGEHRCDGNYDMYQHRHPVRLDTPQLVKFTFRDQGMAIIPLGGYTSVSLLVKREGLAYTSLAAEFDGAKAEGKVKYEGLTFDIGGTWNLQFVAVDNLGHKLYGDPAEVKVTENVDSIPVANILQL